MSIPLLIFWSLSLLTLGICLLALWKGGPPERFGAGAILGIVILGRLIGLLLNPETYPTLRLIEDGLTALALLAVAVRYASFWLGGAMLLYAALFALHAAYFVIGRKPDLIYTVVIDVCFLGVSICLGVGTAVFWRNRVRKRAASMA